MQNLILLWLILVIMATVMMELYAEAS